ncbi:hypothetical protein M8494_02100 [Serratia ureilytica]
MVSTPLLRVTVHQPLWLEWEFCNAAGEWRPLAADRPTSAYLLNAHGDGVAHYQRRFADERYYGLGEGRRSGAHRPPLRNAQPGRHGFTTPPAPIRCTSTFRSPSPAGRRRASACFTTT